MGHQGPWNSTTAQSFKANPSNYAMFANVAVWQRQGNTTVYLLEPCGPLKAYQIVGGRLDPTLLSQSSPATCTKFTGVAVSAKNAEDGTGIVWQTTGNYGRPQAPGTFHPFPPPNL